MDGINTTQNLSDLVPPRGSLKRCRSKKIDRKHREQFGDVIDQWLYIQFRNLLKANFIRSLSGERPVRMHMGKLVGQVEQIYHIRSKGWIRKKIFLARKRSRRIWERDRQKVKAWAIELGVPHKLLFQEYLDDNIEDVRRARWAVRFHLKLCTEIGVKKEAFTFIDQIRELEIQSCKDAREIDRNRKYDKDFKRKILTDMEGDHDDKCFEETCEHFDPEAAGASVQGQAEEVGIEELADCSDL